MQAGPERGIEYRREARRMVAGNGVERTVRARPGVDARIGAADEPEHVGHVPAAPEYAEVLAGRRRRGLVRGLAELRPERGCHAPGRFRVVLGRRIAAQ